MENYKELKTFDLLANVYLVQSEHGGRYTPVFDGYRGQFFWHINDVSATDWDAVYYFENGSLEPGQESLCKIKLSPTLIKTSKYNFPTDRQFGIREGAKIVGIGIIKENHVLKP